MLTSHRLSSVLTVILLFFTLNLLSHHFMLFDTSFLRFSGFILFISILLITILSEKTMGHLKKQQPLLLSSGLILFSVLLLFIAATSMVWLFSIPLFCAGLQKIRKLQGHPSPELSVIFVGSFIYAIFNLCYHTISHVFFVVQKISLTTTQSLGSVFGTPLYLGPTTSGFSILFVFVIMITASIVYQTKKTMKKYIQKYCMFLAVLFIMWFAVLGIVATQKFDVRLNLFSFQFGFFITCLIPTLIFLRIHPPQPTVASCANTTNHHLFRKSIPVICILFLCLSTSMLVLFYDSPEPLEQPKILFYGENMLGTWDNPSYGRYGRDAVGMFGLLPMYLSAAGYTTFIVVHDSTHFLHTHQPSDENILRYSNLTDTTTLLEASTITDDILSDIDVFVVINLNTSFSDLEYAAIWKFVEQGGSLLVLGDHTNVGGIRDPINRLLSPVEIRLQFDSTLPLDQKNQWMTSAEMRYHPVHTHITGFDEMCLGVGASLDIGPTVFPLIIGRYGFSDHGDMSNPTVGYLGDYTYTLDEQFGDIILAAGTYYGAGKVIVFGDTSVFQNSALPSTFSTVANFFSWLLRPTIGHHPNVFIVAFVLLICTAVMSIGIQGCRIPHYIYPVVVCCVVLSIMTVNTFLVPVNTFAAGTTAFIDRSHNERFSHQPFAGESLSGFMMNLHRNNILPFLSKTFSETNIMQSSLVVLSSPTKPFTDEEIMILQKYMHQGGVVLLTTGFPDKQASASLLSCAHLDIASMPLGPVPEPYLTNGTVSEQEPRFYDAYPIIYTPRPTITTYYEFTYGEQTYACSVFSQIGTGGLVLISDSSFLYDTNIESIYDYHPGNIIFIRNLVCELLQKEVNI